MKMIDRPIEHNRIIPSFSKNMTQLLVLVRSYMTSVEVERVKQALELATEKCRDAIGHGPIPPLKHALAVATLLADMHIDAVGLAAGLVFEAIDADLLSLDRVEQTLGAPTARIVGSMERLNILERKKQSASVAGASLNGQEEAGNG